MVDASSSTDQKGTREIGTETEGRVQDLYDKEGRYLKTELIPPETELSEVDANPEMKKGHKR